MSDRTNAPLATQVNGHVSHRLSIDRRQTRLYASVDVRTRLGRNLRRLREAKGWSQEAFAHEAGIHRTYVSDIERGARNPTITVVEKLAMSLDVRTGELLD